MNITVELPKPHSQRQNILMTSLLYPGLEELWCICGTKFGKTLGGDGALVYKALQTRNGIIRHVAPIYSQALIGMRYCERMLPADYISSNKSGHPSINIKHLDTKIEFWHGKDPESLEGEGVAAYLLDECSKLKAEVYSSAKTTLTVTRGPILGTTTPRGKQGKGAWLYNKCMEAKAHMEWSIKKGIPPTKLFITAPTRANPFVTKESIESARRALPTRLFLQYYEAEFVDDGAIFMGFRACIYGDDAIDVFGDMQMWFGADCSKAEVVIGADWGKVTDYTVFTAWNPSERKMIGFMRFRGVDYIQAIKNIYWFSKKFLKLIIIIHDKTGLGQVMDDALAQTGLPYEGITFTNKSKTEMVNALMIAFQFANISIPNWQEMLTELDVYEVQTNSLGTMKYSAPEGQHDDIVSSMFLGWVGVEEYSSPLELNFIGDPDESPDQIQIDTEGKWWETKEPSNG